MTIREGLQERSTANAEDTALSYATYDAAQHHLDYLMSENATNRARDQFNQDLLGIDCHGPHNTAVVAPNDHLPDVHLPVASFLFQVLPY